MLLNIKTDYAIRLIVFAAYRNTLVTASEISQIMHIPQNYIPQVIKNLRKAGILTTYRGVSGGCALCKKPEDITLYDIIAVMEDHVYISQCQTPDSYCSMDATAVCPVRMVYEHLQALCENHLRSITMADLLRANGGEPIRFMKQKANLCREGADGTL